MASTPQDAEPGSPGQYQKPDHGEFDRGYDHGRPDTPRPDQKPLEESGSEFRGWQRGQGDDSGYNRYVKRTGIDDPDNWQNRGTSEDELPEGGAPRPDPDAVASAGGEKPSPDPLIKPPR
jgi:hypothetical protein